MNTRLRSLAIAALLSTAAIPTYAGPFGLSMGMTLPEIKKIASVQATKSPHIYVLSSVPTPHTDIDRYTIFLTPNNGLCKIIASGKTLATSVYGDRVKQEFESFETALKEKYGANKKFDFLRSGSIWNEGKDWMMGLLKKERTLGAFWDEQEKSNLVDSIHSVQLEAVALSREQGYVRLTYEFSNVRACLAEDRAESRKAL